jgi:hypothetical protein
MIVPLGKGVRYRMGPHGVRLAFKGNKVVEAKNMKTGATHTPAEFKADRKKAGRTVATSHR